MVNDLLMLGLAAVSGLAGGVLVVFALRVLVHEFNVARWRASLVAFELRLPRTATVAEVSRWVGTVRAMVPARRWWSPLPRRPLVVETTATRAGIRRVLLVPARLRTEVISTVGALIPGARLDELPDYLTTTQRHRYQAAGEARLRGFGDLLAVGRADDASRHVLAALQPLEAGETVRVQWVVTGARAPRWITAPTTEEKDLPALWRSGDPMLCATCRVAVASRLGRRRAWSVWGRVWASLRGMNTPRARMARRWWVPRVAAAGRLHVRAVPRGRWPVVLTSAELAGLLGFATGAMPLPGVLGGVSRTLPTPPSMPSRGLVLARSNYPGMNSDITQSTRDRLMHTWVLGPTGVGKTTLLANMIGHDIAAGHGAVIVDAGGALVSRVLERIPEHRMGDVIVMDPAATDFVVGVNPLQAGEAEQSASFVYHVLHSIYAKSWGPRTADIMRAALLTLTHTRAPNGAPFTLIETPELLTNSAFRRTVTRQNLSPQLASFWAWYESPSRHATAKPSHEKAANGTGYRARTWKRRPWSG